MILYFIDGNIDCFETSEDYPELEDAFNIDAGNGVSDCFWQMNQIDDAFYIYADLSDEEIFNKNGTKREDYVIVSNFLPFLDVADKIYVYDEKTKTFKNWDDLKFDCEQCKSLGKSKAYLQCLDI